RILNALRDRGSEVDAATVAEVCRREILEVLPFAVSTIAPLPAKPKAVLLVGVNGTGKTTSAAKLAHWFKENRHTNLLVAGDTFRAAAIEQLEVWGQRIGVEVISGQYGGDAAALCYDAWSNAYRKNIEFLICDTAGRLHTKGNLMQELSKVKRTLSKHDSQAPHERLLVVDATTGSNALVQAKEFHQAIDLTGIVLTKLDGSGKGGVAIAIQHELGVPTRFIGTGEKLGDFAMFDRETFVNQML
ncbi:MAG TPA: signal recognition particle-docking protein FtsY, partial [Terrimicrobiaceae bacterium]